MEKDRLYSWAIVIALVLAVIIMGEKPSDKIARVEAEEALIPTPNYEVYTCCDIFYIVDQGYEIEIWAETIGYVASYKSIEEVLEFLERNSHRSDRNYR